MEKPRQTNVRFRERAELLDFLLEVAGLTAETLDLDKLMEGVADIVRQVIPHELFAILLYSDRMKGLRIRYARGHREEVVENMVVALGEGITGAAAQTRQPQLVRDVREDARYLNALDAVRSELAVPMVVRHKLVGVIDLQSVQPDAFSAQDRALLQLIASRVGSAIGNARLYRRVERQNKIQKTLAGLSQEFSSILKQEKLLDKIARSVRTLIPYDAFMVLRMDEKASVMRSIFSVRFDQKLQADAIPMGKGITGAAANSRKPVLARDTMNDARYISMHPGIRSEVAVPLVVNDRVIGVMDLESERVNSFNDWHVQVLSLIAPQIAISLENARLYEELAERERAIQQDLDAASKLQKIIMPPEAPPVRGLTAGVRMRAARQVSGDLFDFFEFDDEHMMLAFGDSSGKGAAAALFGALFSGLLRSSAPRRRSPGQLLRNLNEIVMERQVPARYVALLMMLWQSRERTFTIANAGATPPMVCRAGRTFTPEASGVPVGLLENVEYEETEFAAEPGDVILLYSDGVQDQQNPQGEDYGTARLPLYLPEVAHLPADELAGRILNDVNEFRGSVPVHDDQTVIVMKVD
jgi:sigma-B regulation protein RsbU (phosphoserine phosphatase)